MPARDTLVFALLTFFRLILFASATVCLAYALTAVRLSQEEHHRLQAETFHRQIQWGAVVFTAVESLYYLYISKAFLQWKDRGLAIVIYAAIAAGLAAVFQI